MPCVCREARSRRCSPSQHLSQLPQLSQAMCTAVAPLSPLPCDPAASGSCVQGRKLLAAAYPSSTARLSPIAAVKRPCTSQGSWGLIGRTRALCGRWNLKLGGMWLGLYTAEKHSGDAGRELPAVPPRSCSSLSPSTFVFASQGPLCCHSASVGTLCQNQTSEGQQSWPFVFLPPGINRIFGTLLFWFICSVLNGMRSAHHHRGAQVPQVSCP